MRDEPEREVQFQHIVGLKPACRDHGSLIVTLQAERIRTIEQVAAFVDEQAGGFATLGPGRRLRVRVPDGYRTLDTPSRRWLKRYVAKTTGYMRAQLARLIAQHRETGRAVNRRVGNQGRPSARVCTPADVRLADLGQMSRLATRVVGAPRARRLRPLALRALPGPRPAKLTTYGGRAYPDAV